jgi:hypothetical protein
LEQEKKSHITGNAEDAKEMTILPLEIMEEQKQTPKKCGVLQEERKDSPLRKTM